MANFLDSPQGFEFARAAFVVHAAVHEFDGLRQTAWGRNPPNLAVAAHAKAVFKQVAWNRLGIFT